LEDEQLLWGDTCIEDSIKRYANIYLRELVLKRGAKDVVLVTAGKIQTIPVAAVSQVIDTTAAGDSFNAGYLAARLHGMAASDAVHQGIVCAGIVIRHRGALVEKSLFYEELRSARRTSH
jgi:2-dehydro-3-deoxygluconokinase